MADLIMPQEWDSTFSLTPGKSPPLVSQPLDCTYQSKALTDGSSVMSPQSDSTGDQLLPSPTYEAAASQLVSTTHQLIEIFLPRFLEGSTSCCSPPELPFRRRNLPTTNYLHTALLAHWGRDQLRWADTDGLCPNLRPHEHVREHVRVPLCYSDSAYRRNISPF
jgi:hypothetical protein